MPRKHLLQQQVLSSYHAGHYHAPLKAPVAPSGPVDELPQSFLQASKCLQHTDSVEKATTILLFELRKYLTNAPSLPSDGLESPSNCGSGGADARAIHDFGFSLLDGLRSLTAGKVVQACKYFNTGCNMAGQMIRKQPLSMFDILFAVFLNAAWASFEAVRDQVLTFLSKMTELLLGSCHSMSIILNTILGNDAATFSVPMLFQLMIDTLQGVHKQPSQTINQMKRNLISHVRISGDYNAAEGLIKQELDTSQHNYGNAENVRHVAMVRLLLARSRLDQGYHHEARALYEDILHHDSHSQKNSSTWQEASVYAAGHLGLLDVLDGHSSLGEIRLRSCLDAALPRYGAAELDTEANYHWLEIAEARYQPQGTDALAGKAITDPFQWAGIDWDT